MTRQLTHILGAIAVIGLLLSSACATAPATEAGKTDIRTDADQALRVQKRTEPSILNVLERSSGYAVFPSVGKGAVGVGGAYGKGVLYERGIVVGYCDLTQGTIGVQLGGQNYTEIICFETPAAVETFKQGKFRFDAQATAVALKAGAGANAKFTNNVVVFTTDESGLMFEASIGGQQFTYQPR